jgi:hypothetical protein
MSRGHGTVQRAILAAFAAEPDNAFLLSELCGLVYPGLNRIEKKHRNAVARAAKAIPSIGHMKREVLGGELVLYDPLNVMSYAMAWLKADNIGPARRIGITTIALSGRGHGTESTSRRGVDTTYHPTESSAPAATIIGLSSRAACGGSTPSCARHKRAATRKP